MAALTPEERYVIATHAFRQALAGDEDGVVDDLARLNGDERRALRDRVEIVTRVLDGMEGSE